MSFKPLPIVDYLNTYQCPKCSHVWNDVWDCGCDDDCPECGNRAITPVMSEPVSET